MIVFCDQLSTGSGRSPFSALFLHCPSYYRLIARFYVHRYCYLLWLLLLYLLDLFFSKYIWGVIRSFRLFFRDSKLSQQLVLLLLHLLVTAFISTIKGARHLITSRKYVNVSYVSHEDFSLWLYFCVRRKIFSL